MSEGVETLLVVAFGLQRFETEIATFPYITVCGGEEGWVVDLVRGCGGLGVCVRRGHVARRRHKDGALNAVK